jgi:hypothetical protein
MLENEVDHLLLSFHHLLQIELGWCSRFVIIMRGFIMFWSVVVLVALAIGKGVPIVVSDFASAIGLFFDFCLR